MKMMRQTTSVYLSTEVPADYQCMKCGARGCKLWRQYQTMVSAQELFCVFCASEDQKDSSVGPFNPLSFEADGRAEGKYGKSDQIGWLVPAVPTAENDTFWGYTSVPVEGCAWWRALPTFPEKGPVSGLIGLNLFPKEPS